MTHTPTLAAASFEVQLVASASTEYPCVAVAHDYASKRYSCADSNSSIKVSVVKAAWLQAVLRRSDSGAELLRNMK
jgi:hypothetical protein